MQVRLVAIFKMEWCVKLMYIVGVCKENRTHQEVLVAVAVDQ